MRNIITKLTGIALGLVVAVAMLVPSGSIRTSHRQRYLAEQADHWHENHHPIRC